MLGPTWPYLFLSCAKLKMPNMVFQQEHLNLKNKTHEPIYIWNQYNLGDVFSACVWPYPFLFQCKAPKKAKNGTLTRQILGATNLKHGMHTQLDFGSNMGRIPPVYTSSHWCVKQNSAQKKSIWIMLRPKGSLPEIHFNIYFGSCVFVHMCV